MDAVLLAEKTVDQSLRHTQCGQRSRGRLPAGRVHAFAVPVTACSCVAV